MKVVQPPNPFWIETELNADMTSYLWEQIDNARVNAKNTLVGHHKRNPLRLPDPDHKLLDYICLLYTSPSPRDRISSRMPSSA